MKKIMRLLTFILAAASIYSSTSFTGLSGGIDYPNAYVLMNKIYTVSGEYVQKLEHNDMVDGNEYWNLRNRFNQLIAPGLYIYSVEAEGKKHLGKFAVVR